MTLPRAIMPIVSAFAYLFDRRVFAHVETLLVGAILTPGRRTVAAVLRTMGLSQERHFQNFHRVLSRDAWSARKAAGIVLRMIVDAFAPEGPLVIDVDETLERRRGAKIAKKSLWHDPVRSSRSISVFSEGLRWLVMAASVYVPLAGRVWALPFFSVLMSGPKHDEKTGRHHKSLHIWVIQMLAQVQRWLPGRKIVLVGDGSYAVIELLHWCREHLVSLVTRLRWDAALYEAPPERKAGQRGRPAQVGARLPKLSQVRDDPKTVWSELVIPDWYGGKPRAMEYVTGVGLWKSNGSPAVPIRWVIVRDPAPGIRCDPVALVCTDQEATVEQIVGWFVHRWQIENTFRECRAHLGIETQRQWSDAAIERTTPALLGLFSLVSVMAHRLQEAGKDDVCLKQETAWYTKERPTFSDALTFVRKEIWQARIDPQTIFRMSPNESDTRKIAEETIRMLANALARAA